MYHAQNPQNPLIRRQATVARAEAVHPAHSSQNGFTLIEAMVVTSIIGLLAAVLFPVFASAREQARKVTCLSNLRQIGLGIMQYVQDNDERYPQAFSAGDQNGEGGYSWQVAVSPYINKDIASTVWQCPDSSDQFHGYGAHQDVFVGNPVGATIIKSPYSLSDISTPSDTIMLAEKGDDPGVNANPPVIFKTDKGSFVGPGGSDVSVSASNDNDNGSGSSHPRYRHSGNMVCNVVFFDGRAKGMHKGTITYGTNIYVPGVPSMQP